MYKLIEFKLHNGQFPYFVHDVINGVDVDGKRYGVSRNTRICYLPDTVRTLDIAEFVDIVRQADIYKKTDTDNGITDSMPMSDEEKETFAHEWLQQHKELTALQTQEVTE